jgi:hypothetical protein
MRARATVEDRRRNSRKVKTPGICNPIPGSVYLADVLYLLT